MIYSVPVEDYPALAPRIWPFLKGFEDRDLDGATARDMEEEILARRVQVWVIGDFKALALTRVTRDAVRIDRCAGKDRGEWQGALLDMMKGWASDLGKRRVISLMRPGWSGFAKQVGARERHREYTLELGNG